MECEEIVRGFPSSFRLIPHNVSGILPTMAFVSHIRRTQLLLPPALKVAKSDFEPQIAEQLANDQSLCDSRGVLFLSLASCSAVHSSKSDFATFNVGGKSN